MLAYLETIKTTAEEAASTAATSSTNYTYDILFFTIVGFILLILLVGIVIISTPSFGRISFDKDWISTHFLGNRESID